MTKSAKMMLDPTTQAAGNQYELLRNRSLRKPTNATDACQYPSSGVVVQHHTAAYPTNSPPPDDESRTPECSIGRSLHGGSSFLVDSVMIKSHGEASHQLDDEAIVRTRTPRQNQSQTKSRCMVGYPRAVLYDWSVALSRMSKARDLMRQESLKPDRGT